MRAGLSATEVRARARSGALAALLFVCALALSACDELADRSLGSDRVESLIDAGIAPEIPPCMLSDASITTTINNQIDHWSESVCRASPLDRKCPVRTCYEFLDKSCGEACLLYVLRLVDLQVNDHLHADGSVPLPWLP